MISTETVTESAALMSEEALRKSILELHQQQGAFKKQVSAVYNSGSFSPVSLIMLLSEESGIFRAQQLLQKVRAARAQQESTAKMAHDLQTGLHFAEETKQLLPHFRCYWPEWRKAMQLVHQPQSGSQHLSNCFPDWKRILRRIKSVIFFDKEMVEEFLALDILVRLCRFCYCPSQSMEEYNGLKSKLSEVQRITGVSNLLTKDPQAQGLINFFLAKFVEKDKDNSYCKDRFIQDDETNHSSNQKTHTKLGLGKRDSLEGEEMFETCKHALFSQESITSKKNSAFLHTIGPESVKNSFDGARSAPVPAKPNTLVSPHIDEVERKAAESSNKNSPVSRGSVTGHVESAFDFTDSSFIQDCSEEAQLEIGRPGMNDTERTRLHAKREIYSVLVEKFPSQLAREYVRCLEAEIFGAHHKELGFYRAQAKRCANVLKHLTISGKITSSALSTRLQYAQIMAWAGSETQKIRNSEREDDDISIRSFNSTASNLVLESRLLDQVRKIPNSTTADVCTGNPDSLDLIDGMCALKNRETEHLLKVIRDLESEKKSLRLMLEPYRNQIKQQYHKMLRSNPEGQ